MYPRNSCPKLARAPPIVSRVAPYPTWSNFQHQPQECASLTIGFSNYSTRDTSLFWYMILLQRLDKYSSIPSPGTQHDLSL